MTGYNVIVKYKPLPVSRTSAASDFYCRVAKKI
jgi:hypothetical protein